MKISRCIFSKSIHFLAPIFVFGKLDALDIVSKSRFYSQILFWYICKFFLFEWKFFRSRYAQLGFIMRYFKWRLLFFLFSFFFDEQLLLWANWWLFDYNLIKIKLLSNLWTPILKTDKALSTFLVFSWNSAHFKSDMISWVVILKLNSNIFDMNLNWSWLNNQIFGQTNGF